MRFLYVFVESAFISFASATGGTTVGPKPRVMKPMTKEEWEKKQSVMRHVYDAETGRTRLVTSF